MSPNLLLGVKNNEAKARQEYVKYMEENGHHGIKTTLAGFVVHPHKCWLGASPDAWVSDPSVRDKQGIAEFKCPYSKAFVHPEEACKDTNFYCSITNGKLHLKKNMLIIIKYSYSCMFHATTLSGVIFVCIPHVVLPLKGFIQILNGKAPIVLNLTIIT